MQNEYKRILAEIFNDVLMKYAFTFGEPCPKEELPLSHTGYLHAKVAFKGDQFGVLGVSTTPDLCIEMAANVLGIDQSAEDSIEDALDVLEELTNVVCGQFLTSAFGEEPIFDLLPPSILRIDEAEWWELITDEDVVGFMVESAPAVVYVRIEREDENDSGVDRG